jgi:hypothetical protein
MKKSFVSTASDAKKTGRPSTASAKSTKSKSVAKTFDLPKRPDQADTKKLYEQKFTTFTPLKADSSRKNLSPLKKPSLGKASSKKLDFSPVKQARTANR